MNARRLGRFHTEGATAMLWYLFLLLAGLAAWRLAASEDRTEWPWALGVVIAAWLLGGWMGSFGFAAPVVALAGEFVLLWWLRERDDRERRDRPGERVIR